MLIYKQTVAQVGRPIALERPDGVLFREIFITSGPPPSRVGPQVKSDSGENSVHEAVYSLGTRSDVVRNNGDS